MRTILIGGALVTPFQILEDHALILDDGIISGIQPADRTQAKDNDKVIDCSGKWLTPGLIDVHTHGGNRADAMDASHESFDTLGNFFAACGVTAYLLTTGAASNQAISDVINSFRTYSPSKTGAVPLGIHLEGPYLDEKNKGAQPVEQFRPPTSEEYLPWFQSGAVKLMTIAPELDGVEELIRAGISFRVEFAAGHTDAAYEQMLDAIGWGLRQATHTFNGMTPLHHRTPGVVGAVLSDPRVYAQVIPDGIHVHPAVVKALVSAKGIEKTILITDSIRAAGLSDGDYDLLGQVVTVKDGVARVASGSLAGSVVTMDAAIRNAMKFCDLGFRQAVFMATYTPAASLNLHGNYGVLRPGARADITVFDAGYHIEKTLVGGEIVYANDH